MKRIALLACGISYFALTAPLVSAEEMHPLDQLIAKNRQRIAEASACTERPRSKGEIFALAMQDYWQREQRKLWQQDAYLNQCYLQAQGRIDVTDKDCGLVRDAEGKPLRMGRDTCRPWKLMEYNTLDKVAERLKHVPEFGARLGFDQPGKHEGGWIYDAIVRDLLRGEAWRPDTEFLYLPEHADGNAGFAVLYKRGNAVRWYGPDCCALMSIEEGEKEEKQRGRSAGYVTQREIFGKASLPSGISPYDLYYLRISYHDVDFNLNSGQGGVYALGKGQLDDYNMRITRYLVVSPCGTLVCLDNKGPCR